LSRVDQLGDVARPDDPWKALEGAHVGDDGQSRLADGEDGVGGRQPDVTGGDQVDPGTQAIPVDGGDHRHRAGGERRHRRLETAYRPVQSRIGGGVRIACRLVPGDYLEADAHRKLRAAPATTRGLTESSP